MGNNNKGRGTVSKTVSKGQKKNSKVSNDKKSRNVEKNEKESIFQEVTINLKNTEYNQKKYLQVCLLKDGVKMVGL